MINMQLEFFSPTLNMRTKVNVLLPEFAEITAPLPVIYVLHGLTGNCDDWIRMGKAQALLRNYPVIAVFPSAHNSFYSNMRYGQDFYTHIAQELQDYVEGLLPIDRTQRYLCGLSMGGYGALKLALREPDRYRAAGAFSGVLDIANEANFARFPRELEACFGKSVPAEDNLFALAENPACHTLPIYIACGTEDALFIQNERFVQENPQLRIDYIKEPGAHEWVFWERHLAKFLSLHFQEKTAN